MKRRNPMIFVVLLVASLPFGSVFAQEAGDPNSSRSKYRKPNAWFNLDVGLSTVEDDSVTGHGGGAKASLDGTVGVNATLPHLNSVALIGEGELGASPHGAEWRAKVTGYPLTVNLKNDRFVQLGATAQREKDHHYELNETGVSFRTGRLDRLAGVWTLETRAGEIEFSDEHREKTLSLAVAYVLNLGGLGQLQANLERTGIRADEGNYFGEGSGQVLNGQVLYSFPLNKVASNAVKKLGLPEATNGIVGFESTSISSYKGRPGYKDYFAPKIGITVVPGR